MDEDRRVIFYKGKQKEFLELVKRKLGLNWKELASLTNFGYHQLVYELRNEIYSMSNKDFINFCNLIEKTPRDYGPYIKEYRDKNWGQKLAGLTTGNKNKGKAKIKIKFPKLDVDLAEYIGIILGDGSICKTHYCIDIILNKNTDKFYADYVLNLYNQLFGLTPKITEKESTLNIRVNSIALFNFLKGLGMPHGSSEKFIPRCILSEKKLVHACIRGLFDTDGSLHLSSRWCVLNYTSSSKSLYDVFFQNLEDFGLNPIRSGNMINLTSLWKIKKFFSIIGSSNLKNIIKYLEYTVRHNSLKSDETIEFYNNYRKTKLPFMGS